MAFDGVFAFQGKNHITASQLGRLVQGTAGDGRYVLPTQDRLQATMQTANKVVIGSGDLVMDGRYVTNESGVELTVESGTSGYNRNDIVALRYSKDGSTGVESFEPEVIKGTPVTGTAADPAVDAGAISDGSSEALMPLWRIPIRGLAPGTPERIATVGKTLSEIGDSVSPTTLFASDRGSTESISLSEPVSSFQFVDILYGRGRSTRVRPSRDRQVILSDHVYSKVNNAHYISSEMIEVSGSSIARSVSGNCGRLIISGKDIQADLSGLQAINAVFGYR